MYNDKQDNNSIIDKNREIYQSSVPTKLKIIDREDFKKTLDISLSYSATENTHHQTLKLQLTSETDH